MLYLTCSESKAMCWHSNWCFLREGCKGKQHHFHRKQNPPSASPPGLSPSSTFMFQNTAHKNPSHLYHAPFCFAWNSESIYLCLADKNRSVCLILLPQIPLNPNTGFPLCPHPSQKSVYLHRNGAKRGLCCSPSQMCGCSPAKPPRDLSPEVWVPRGIL